MLVNDAVKDEDVAFERFDSFEKLHLWIVLKALIIASSRFLVKVVSNQQREQGEERNAADKNKHVRILLQEGEWILSEFIPCKNDLLLLC